MIEPIYLSKNDLEKIKNFKIGMGSDASVYKIPPSLIGGEKGVLFKIYHKSSLNNNIENNSNDNDIKIYNKENLKFDNIKEPISYLTNNDGVRLRSKEAIYKAIDRQKNISMTNLPKNVIYVDNHFAGCVLKEQRGTQIHYLTGFPMKYKIMIMKNIILKLKELYSNNVYHVDLANSPFSQSFYIDEFNQQHCMAGHSHILIHHFQPYLIDLDGKSTIYTECFNEKYYKIMIEQINILLVEFLLKLQIDNILDDINGIELLENELNKYNIPNNYIDSLSDLSLDLDHMNEFLDNISSKKKILY